MNIDPEIKEAVYGILRAAHSEGQLSAVIGEALGKNAILIIAIDVRGGVTITGQHVKDTDNSIRDGEMLKQMAELFGKNMQDMMKKAGQIAREVKENGN